MSLDEKNNEKTENSIIKINCRGKTVYVPYYTALKFDFFQSYLENWKKYQNENGYILTIDDYNPEFLQAEIDKVTNVVLPLQYLGYNGDVLEEKKEKQDIEKEVFLEDLFYTDENGKVCFVGIENEIAVSRDCTLPLNSYINIGFCVNPLVTINKRTHLVVILVNGDARYLITVNSREYRCSIEQTGGLSLKPFINMICSYQTGILENFYRRRYLC